ncbi:MAG: hypothetical protein LBJ73_04190 [Rickettsiales bacterium]|jgi:hypothetical protein|nr:hypothetical protein [Rickettsiales bacterium]
MRKLMVCLFMIVGINTNLYGNFYDAREIDKNSWNALCSSSDPAVSTVCANGYPGGAIGYDEPRYYVVYDRPDEEGGAKAGVFACISERYYMGDTVDIYDFLTYALQDSDFEYGGVLPYCQEPGNLENSFAYNGLCCNFGTPDVDTFQFYGIFCQGDYPKWDTNRYKCYRDSGDGTCYVNGACTSCADGYYMQGSRCVGCDEVAGIKRSDGGSLFPATHMTSVSPRNAIANCALKPEKYKDSTGTFELSDTCPYTN